MEEKVCPRCHQKSVSFHPLSESLIAKLKESSGEEDSQFPTEVCINCFTQLAGGVSRGSVLVAHEKAKEQKKLMMWKSRVNYIKKARQFMMEKAFSDAAVHYEKYIRVLEVVFDVGPGELTPEHFKDSARTQELTVVASTYWDLLRIYDTSSQYGERQALASRKLGQFLRFTPIFPDILRKAELFEKTAKNPALIRQFVKSVSQEKGRCFIATAAFESPEAPQVQVLCYWRDYHLVHHWWGRWFIRSYYFFSPWVARLLDRHAFLKPPLRKALNALILRLHI